MYFPPIALIRTVLHLPIRMPWWKNMGLQGESITLIQLIGRSTPFVEHAVLPKKTC